MTPFAGVGVNLAMEDALQLSRALVKNKAGCGARLEDAIAGYERPMFERAEKYATMTFRNQVREFGPPPG